MSTSGASRATIAGVLEIVAGGTGFAGACVLALVGLIGHGVMRTVPDEVPNALAFVPLAFFLPMAGFLLLLGLLAIAGGIAALRRGPWWLAVVGSAAALLIFIPLGIAALVFVVLAEDEIRK